MTNSERYNNFKKNPIIHWENRFIWNGFYGNESWTNLSIIRFAQDTARFKDLFFENTLNFYKEIKSISNDYVNWCSTQIKEKDKEPILNELRQFFIGAIGEFFFTKLFEHKNSLVVREKKIKYDFYDICPRLIADSDFGVDLTGVVSHNGKTYDCVFQVKFWSPFIDSYQITNKIIQPVHSDAIENEMIDNKDDDNIFICWLGNKEHISKYIAKNKVSRHVVFIDRDVLKSNIDNDSKFWEKMCEELSNL